MNILCLSDLHFECHMDSGAAFTEFLDPTGVDVLILAGDICTSGLIHRALKLLCARFADVPVLYVRGNHDLWDSSFPKSDRHLRDVEKFIPNLHFLENDVFEFEGQRFLGTTLWFEDDPLNVTFRGMYADFKRIRDFTPHVYEVNARAQEFLRREVQKDDVVITHMAPSTLSIPDEFRSSRLNRFYVCDMQLLIADRGPKCWFHGHTHSSFDYMAGDTRIICNPLGYARVKENAKFDPRKILTL